MYTRYNCIIVTKIIYCIYYITTVKNVEQVVLLGQICKLGNLHFSMM